MPPDQHRFFGFFKFFQNGLQSLRFRPGFRWRFGFADKGPFISLTVFLKGRKHDVYRNAQMHRPGITAEGNLKGTVNKLWNSRSIRYGSAVFGQRGCNRNIIYFLESAAPLSLKGARTGDENHR